MRIVHSFVDSEAAVEAPTWEVRRSAVFPLDWIIEDVDCAQTPYETAFFRHWGEDDLINWERDLVPTLDQFKILATCPELLCAWDYIVGTHSISRVADVRNQYRSIAPEDGYADAVGLGFVKISQVFQTQWPRGAMSLRQGHPWADFDGRLMTWTHAQGLRWHVHRPLIPHTKYSVLKEG